MSFTGFLKKADRIREQTAKFYRADLHVHTHDSDDYLDVQDAEERAGFHPEELAWRQDKQAIPLATYAKWIEACRPDIEIVAITDHHACDVACGLAGTPPRGRLILPGIEVKVRLNQMSLETIHLLCLFPPERDPQSVWNHVAASSSDTYRQTAPLHVFDLPRYVRDQIHGSGGICIAAHVDAGSGLRRHFFDITSVSYINLQMRKRVLAQTKVELESAAGGDSDGNPHQDRDVLDRQLAAIDAEVELIAKQQNEKACELQESFLQLIADCRLDAIQVQKESDAQHYRGQHTRSLGLLPVATLLASDSHCAAAIGKKSTWLKMPQLSFAGVRRALDFPSCRVRLGEYQRPRYPKLLALRFVPDEGSQSFFPKSGQEFQTVGFADNLTCLIGGRGSGKSAIIDAIKLLFRGAPPESAAIAAKMKGPDDKLPRELPEWLRRLLNTMRGTTIQAAFQFEDANTVAERFIASLPFDFRLQSRLTIFSSEGKDTGITMGDPRLEIDVYGWSEIEALGASSAAQLQLVDKFAHTTSSSSDIDEIVDLLVKNRAAITATAREAGVLVATHELTEYVQRKKEHDFYNRPEVAAAFLETDKLIEQIRAVEALVGEVEQAITHVRDLDLAGRLDKAVRACGAALAGAGGGAADSSDDQGSARCEPDADTQKLLADDRVRRLRLAVAALVKVLREYLIAARPTSAFWQRELSTRLGAIMQESEGKDAVAKERRLQAKNRFSASIDRLKAVREKLKAIDDMLMGREKLVALLQEACRDRTAARKSTIILINARLNEVVNGPRIHVQIDLGEQTDRKEFLSVIEAMLARAGRSVHYRDRKAGRLASIVSAASVRNALLAGAPKPFVTGSSVMEETISDIQARAIVDANSPLRSLALSDDGSEILTYYDPDRLSDVLLVDEVLLNDAPTILLNPDPAGTGKPTPIAELSPGQRCSAMLPIILLRGNCPVIIDQPEDNLDNRLICDVVVDVLQRLKEHRQIILATHNPNIPVSGDAEQIVVTEAISRMEGRVAKMGPIDDDEVISHVKSIMEGGDEAFRLRARRYNYDLRPLRLGPSGRTEASGKAVASAN